MIRSRQSGVNALTGIGVLAPWRGGDLPDETDDFLTRAMGGDLQSATVRIMLYLGAVAAVVATIVVIVT